MNESQAATNLKRVLKRYGYFFKTTGTREAGVPDIVGEYKGLFLGIEVKVHPNKLTKLQQYVSEEISNYYTVTYHPKERYKKYTSNIADGFFNAEEVIDIVLCNLVFSNAK